MRGRTAVQVSIYTLFCVVLVMATRAVLQAFERYQKERVAFVTAVAEMAKSPQVGGLLSSWYQSPTPAGKGRKLMCLSTGAEYRSSAAGWCYGSTEASAFG